MNQYYVCPVKGCGNRFMGRRRFLEHNNTHDEEYVKKNLLCECGRRFTSRGNLAAHRRRWCNINNSKSTSVKLLNVQNLNNYAETQDTITIQNETQITEVTMLKIEPVNDVETNVDITASNDDLFLELDPQDYYVKLQDDTLELDKEQNHLQLECENLEWQKLKDDHSELQIRHKDLQNDHQQLQFEFEKLKNEYLSLQSEHEKLENDLENWKLQIERQVIQVVQFETFDESQEVGEDCQEQEDVEILVVE